MSQIITTSASREVMEVEAHQARIQTIQRVMRTVMKNGIHYGPAFAGSNKPTLLKAGAEVIMATFRICPEIDAEELIDVGGHVRYRVKVKALSADGMFLGEGIGEGSTGEEKYAWEAAACDEHWESLPESKRRIKWKRDGGQIKQVATNPTDKANTVLKMAKKRALVDMVLTVTAASDVFDQDLEEDADGSHGPAPLRQPQAKKAQPAATQQARAGNHEVGVIEKVVTNTGQSQRGEWTRFGVLLNGNWHNTFDTTIGELCDACWNQSVPIDIVYTDSDKGRNIVSAAEAQSQQGGEEQSGSNAIASMRMYINQNAGKMSGQKFSKLLKDNGFTNISEVNNCAESQDNEDAIRQLCETIEIELANGLGN